MRTEQVMRKMSDVEVALNLYRKVTNNISDDIDCMSDEYLIDPIIFGMNNVSETITNFIYYPFEPDPV